MVIIASLHAFLVIMHETVRISIYRLVHGLCFNYNSVTGRVLAPFLSYKMVARASLSPISPLFFITKQP